VKLPCRWQRATNNFLGVSWGLSFPYPSPRHPIFIMNKALFVDLDGTVRSSFDNGEEIYYPKKLEHIFVYPEAGPVIRKFQNNGYLAIVVSNQSGISAKEFSFAQCREMINYTGAGLGVKWDGVYFAASWNKTHIRRKPYPTMAFEAEKKFNLCLKDSIMVGDLETDKEFAKNAGIGRFYWPDDLW
jgi:D-glycero-D-manno-heptose 1,7-bisphosphate phosphatase